MDQIVQFNPDFVISSLNVHRLLITSIMVRTDCQDAISQSACWRKLSIDQLASKFFDDVYYNNAYYARVGGISNAEVSASSTTLMDARKIVVPIVWWKPELAPRIRAGELAWDGDAPDDLILFICAARTVRTVQEVFVRERCVGNGHAPHCLWVCAECGAGERQFSWSRRRCMHERRRLRPCAGVWSRCDGCCMMRHAGALVKVVSRICARRGPGAWAWHSTDG